MICASSVRARLDSEDGGTSPKMRTGFRGMSDFSDDARSLKRQKVKAQSDRSRAMPEKTRGRW